MRILIAASTFPRRTGDDLPRFVLDLSLALQAHGHTVVALVPDAEGLPAHERWGELEIHRFRYFWPRRLQRLAYGAGMSGNLRRQPITWLQPLPYLWRLCAATRSLAREARIDVVNSHWLLPQGLGVALARGRQGGFRHVATLHGGDAHLLRRLPGGGGLARYTLRRSDAVIAVSSNVRRQLEQATGHDSGARLQPMGVDLQGFRDAPTTQERPFPQGYLLFVGRLIPIKGVAVLLEALAALRARNPGLGLVVIGDGPEGPALRERARALGLAEAVRFQGGLPHDEIAPWLRGCRAAVVPSVVRPGGRAEGMPTVIPEALAAGARVVASHAGGVTDILEDGRNAWLAAPGDPADLARRIQAALEERADSPLLLRAAATAETLDWSRVAENYLGVFEEVLGRGDPGQ